MPENAHKIFNWKRPFVRECEHYMTALGYIIGLDFDNTMISYDDLIYTVAAERRLVDATVGKSKKEIRDHILKSPDGDIEWQKLQATIYGERINEAAMFEGAEDFLRICKQNGAKLYVVSHKTDYASMDRHGINLRDAAIGWMRSRALFNGDYAGLSEGDVFFESTRGDKCERIRSLRCTHFIDDLEEVFLEESFPGDVKKVLFDPHRQYASREGIINVSNWEEIRNIFFEREC